jgi:hypothetical protein
VKKLKTDWQRGNHSSNDKKLIQSEINRFNSTEEPLIKIQQQTVEVKESMMKNIDSIILNLEKLDSIESRSEDVSKLI